MMAPSVFYDVASGRLDEQLARIDALDGKASTAFGFSAALLPIFGVFFAAADHPTIATILYIAAVIVYLWLVLAATLAYRVAGWSYRPDLGTLRGHSRSRAEDDVRMWAAEECVRSIDTNEPRLRRKANYVTLTLGLLAADAILLSLAAIATLT
jgi:hypothetical protein